MDITGKNIDERCMMMRDEAFDQSRAHHRRIGWEWGVYENQGGGATGMDLGIGTGLRPGKASVLPKITTAINRLMPAFRTQMPDVEIHGDEHSAEIEDALYIKELESWIRMMEDVDKEGERLRQYVKYGIVCGNAISKVYWDSETHVVRCPTIHPCTFAPYPSTCRSDLSDAQFVVHTVFHTGKEARRRYKKNARWDDDDSIRVDEMWMTRTTAKEFKFNVDVDGATERTRMYKVVMVDDEYHSIEPSPFWYPCYPFVSWKLFELVDHQRHAMSFWGHGYALLFWQNQQLLDQLMSDILKIIGNLSVGRWIHKEGALHPEQALQGHSRLIPIPDDYEPGKDVQYIPAENMPPALFQILAAATEEMQSQMPSLNPAFSGEGNWSGTSGRTVNSLQQAAHTQIADGIGALNDSRIERMRLRIETMRQFCRRVSEPFLWRAGIDLPDQFPDHARYIGYHLTLPQEGSMSNTIAGRIQLVSMIYQMGYEFIDPGALLKYLGLTRGQGILPTDIVRVGQGTGGENMQGHPPDLAAASGVEAVMSSER